jgi:hypothetical protein
LVTAAGKFNCFNKDFFPSAIAREVLGKFSFYVFIRFFKANGGTVTLRS